MTQTANGTSKDRLILQHELTASDVRGTADLHLGILKTRVQGDVPITTADMSMTEVEATQDVIRRDIHRTLERHFATTQDTACGPDYTAHVPADLDIAVWPVTGSNPMPFQALGWVSSSTQINVLGAHAVGYLDMLMASREVVVGLVQQAVLVTDDTPHDVAFRAFQTAVVQATEPVTARQIAVFAPTSVYRGICL